MAFGCLAFAGEQAINAVFAMSIVGNYIAYAIPIAARFIGDNDFKPGPFNLGTLVHAANMNYTSVVLCGIMILSVAWFYFPKYGGVYWFTGPVANIDLPSESIGPILSNASEERTSASLDRKVTIGQRAQALRAYVARNIQRLREPAGQAWWGTERAPPALGGRWEGKGIESRYESN
ncbi:hypothetical protein H0H87_006337 [Tephrocybe sp. NHM501043]|nr:hypothetical protein H0H87_006337 [Tephrocybe sp. NHM501043]